MNKNNTNKLDKIKKVESSGIALRRKRRIEEGREYNRKHPMGKCTVGEHERIVVSKLNDPLMFDVHMGKVTLAMKIAVRCKMLRHLPARNYAIDQVILIMETFDIDVAELRERGL